MRFKIECKQESWNSQVKDKTMITFEREIIKFQQQQG
jgi:hypothetical protein